MRKAEEENRLFKEQPFVIGVEAKDINPKYSSEELILVQGIIDAYFIEDGEIILVDYKTDYVSNKGKAAEEELKKRYQVQLDYYKKALEQLHKVTVKEKIIYSFDLEQEIVL